MGNDGAENLKSIEIIGRLSGRRGRGRFWSPALQYSDGAFWNLETNMPNPISLISNSFCASGEFLSNGTMVNNLELYRMTLLFQIVRSVSQGMMSRVQGLDCWNLVMIQTV